MREANLIKVGKYRGNKYGIKFFDPVTTAATEATKFVIESSGFSLAGDDISVLIAAFEADVDLNVGQVPTNPAEWVAAVEALIINSTTINSGKMIQLFKRYCDHAEVN